MNIKRRWIIIFLTLVLATLIGRSMFDPNDETENSKTDPDEPTYVTTTSKSLVYSPDGRVNYQLISGKASFYEADQLSWFKAPVLTVYDQDDTPIWKLQADRARLTQNKLLYLYDHVVLEALSKDSRLQRVTTDSAVIDLTTQDINSDDEVILTGQGFISTGLKLRGNLRNKTARLLEKVNTSYEISDSK